MNTVASVRAFLLLASCALGAAALSHWVAGYSRSLDVRCRILRQRGSHGGHGATEDPWLCYHARHNNVYFDGRLISDSPVPPSLPFSKIPDLANVDFVATRDRILDLRTPSASLLTLVDDVPGEDPTDGHDRYWLGPPVGLRFLALQPMSANLKMRIAPAPETTTFPIDFFLTDDQGHVSQGEIRGETVEVRRMNFPRGLSYLKLSVKAKDSDPNTGPSFPILAELDGLEISDIDLELGK